MKLVEFYINVIKSLQMEVDNDVVCVGNDPLTIGGVPVALPTNNIINKICYIHTTLFKFCAPHK